MLSLTFIIESMMSQKSCTSRSQDFLIFRSENYRLDFHSRGSNLSTFMSITQISITHISFYNPHQLHVFWVDDNSTHRVWQSVLCYASVTH